MAPAGPSLNMKPVLIGAGILALAGLGAFAAATRHAAPGLPQGARQIAVSETACEPMAITVPAGAASFVIRNASSRPLEWEILDGVMVVAERENIAPGFTATLTEWLKPGSYQITCGLLSNPRGTLTVTPTAQSEAARAAPPTAEFIGPLSEMRVRLIQAGAALERDTGALEDAVAAGDLDAAKAAYGTARASWARLGTATARASDLANRMSPAAAVLAGREADPGFTGFHRIEHGLWTKGATEGQEPAARALAADATELKARLRDMAVDPADIAGDAARLARHIADGQARQGVNLYSGQDAAEFDAALDSIAGAAKVLAPLTTAAAPDAAKTVESRIAATRSAIAAMGASPDAEAREDVAQGFAALGQALDALNPALGLDAGAAEAGTGAG